jgi:hypothetical protein
MNSCTGPCGQGSQPCKTPDACQLPIVDSEGWKRQPDPLDVICGVVMHALAGLAIVCTLAAAAGFFFNR